MDVESLTKGAKLILGAVATLGAVISALLAVNSYIDRRIEKKIREPSFMREIRENVVPSVIFDSHNRVRADSGGMKFLNGIRVIPNAKNEGVPSKIVVSPKEFLPVEPLLLSLDAEQVDIKAERGENTDWVYTLTVRKAFDGELETVRFCLVILR